jgi:hypothetical protein
VALFWLCRIQIRRRLAWRAGAPKMSEADASDVGSAGNVD